MNEKPKKPEEETIEEKLSSEDNSLNIPKDNAETQDTELPRLEKYIQQFTTRYKSEGNFKNLVHQYLELTGWNMFGLNFKKKFFKKSYEKQTNDMINVYAEQVYEEQKYAIDIKKDLLALKKAEEELLKNTTEVITTSAELEKTQQEAEKIGTEKKEKKQIIFDEFENKKQQITNDKKKLSEEVVSEFDLNKLVNEKFTECITSTGFIQNDGTGGTEYNVNNLMGRLEEIFLKEIVSGIENEDGSGFMSKVQAKFEGTIDHWDKLSDISEINNVDWIQSTVYSMTKGFRRPQFPYYIAGKYGMSMVDGKTSIDTAISIDTSGSMESCNRFDIAKKTTLALNALMRKLNPDNKTYLSTFDEDVKEVTTADLYKINVPRGNHTFYANPLNWMFEKLVDKGPSIAYLVTDGLPHDPESTKKTALLFAEHPYIKLRIVLIGGGSYERETVKEFGMAAGPGTMVIPVKDYDNYNNKEWGGDILRDISKAIGELQNIEDF
ncbi:MAG: hypothetical protein ABIC91_07170 [Nanoarchaeota archaeon]|nr:hypothetical protein [Nanoarchaeota archaeon]MBU1031095.1 hypothetical protein [Nanoarchaeota archaeon]MBU1849692.1 hypothetical protein [Nanoarchaeota archaeon]